jgi:hypothetical protein
MYIPTFRRQRVCRGKWDCDVALIAISSPFAIHFMVLIDILEQITTVIEEGLTLTSDSSVTEVYVARKYVFDKV